MKKKLFYLFIFFLINSNSHSDIVYLDVQYIVDNSNLGKFYKNKIKSSEDNALKKLKDKETIISKKENEIKNQKNILKKDEMNNKLSELNTMIVDYRSRKKKNWYNNPWEKKRI